MSLLRQTSIVVLVLPNWGSTIRGEKAQKGSLEKLTVDTVPLQSRA